MATASYALGHAQASGGRYVKETHTDDFGVVEIIEYGPIGVVDYNQIMLNRAATIAASKVAAEIDGNISEITNKGSLAVTVFSRSTKAQNIGPLREAYRAATRESCIMIADYLATLTDAQLRSIFSKTQAEVTVLRADKLTPAIALANSLRTAGGE